MTKLEKARELRPELTEHQIIHGYCPEDILAMEMVDCGQIGDCRKCWNAEWQEEQEG